MPFTVIKQSDESILLVRLDLDAITDEVQAGNLRAQILRHAAQVTLPLFVVLDFQQKELDASDVQLMLYDAQEHPEGTVADARLRMLMVSDHPVLTILQRKVREQFGVNIWQFLTVEDAFVWARAQLADKDDG